MFTRRVRKWGIAAAVAALVVIAVLVALPFVVRSLAVRRVEAMTGRPVTIADVDLNLFTRRLIFNDVRIASPGEAPPLAQAPRVEARFRFLPLFGGRVYLDRLEIHDPAVYVARGEGGTLNAEDVVEHWLARPAGEPVQATLAHVSVQGGRLTFADQAVEPAREWVLQGLAAEARNIATVADAAAGRLSATFVVAGAAGELHIEDLRVRPFAAHASLGLEALDIAPFAAYLPADAPIRFAGGRFSTRVAADYDARGFVRARGESTVRDVLLTRPGQDEPFVTAPVLELQANDITYAGGTLSAADLVLAAERATVFDARAPRARPLDVRDLRFTFHDARVPAAGPGRITLTAALPEGGTLEARGTGEILPPASDLTVEIRGLDVALARMWMPPDAAITPVAGKAGATLSLRYARAPGLAVGGRAWITDIAIARRGEPAPIVRDDRVEVTVTDLAADDAGARLGRLHVTASPTVAIGGATARPLHLPEVTLTATGGRFPGRAPTRIEARIRLPHGGRVTATGEAQLAVPSAALRVVASDVDAMVAVPYLPPDAPVTIDGGRLDARLAVRWRDVVGVDGTVTFRALTVRRRGESTPLVEHARLDAALTDLELGDAGLSLRRLTLTGAPVIVDATASPPQRFEMRELQLTATGVTWPGRRSMRLEGHAVAASGGTATLTGTLHPASLATDVRVAFEGVDVTRARGYIPDGTPLAVDDGRAQGTVRLRSTRATGVRLDGEGTIRDLALTLANGPVARIVDDQVTFSVENLVLKDGALRVDAAVVEGSPQVGRGGELAPAFELRATLEELAWPTGPPAALTLTAQSGDGRLDVRGTFAPATRVVEATVHAEAAAIAPVAVVLPIDAPVGGRLDAQLRVALRPGAPAPLEVRGHFTVHDLRIGPADTAPVRAAALEVEDFALEGRAVDIARVTLVEPSVLVEREEEGGFPLRAMLTPDAAGAASPPAGAASPRPDAPDVRPAGGSPEPERWRVSIDTFRIADGAVRFIDRTTQPFYSEEITRLEVTVRDISNTTEQRAGVSIQGIVGVDAALDLRGEVAPFASPFFMEVSGELRDFAVPRTNPYLQRFLDWIARRGQLTTKVHYRIVGTELHATNELVVHRLDVERARAGDGRAERLVGVPLGLAVALLKDAKGDIRFTLPVTGELGSPKFSFGDAIKSALSNVLGKLVTAPFRAIGKVFERDGTVEDVRIDPVTFPPGSAALTPDAATQLQRVGDFLRASPYIRLGLEPVVSAHDLRALKAREVTARIQRVQREEQLDDFVEAARRVWRLSLPDAPEPPDDPQAIVTALAEREPPPSDEARQLAERRESVTRTHLVDAAGISGDRLLSDPGAPRIGADGDGRVEFDLQPAS